MRRAWVNGRIVDAESPHVLISDAGFRSGVGVRETVRARRGVLVEWRDHVARLREAAAVLGIVAIPGDDELAEWCRALLEAEGLAGSGAGVRDEPGDATVRLTVTPGSTDTPRIGAGPGPRTTPLPTIVVEVNPSPPSVAQGARPGVRTVTSSFRVDPASPLAGMRTTSEADRYLAGLEATRAGADDALLSTIDGRLAGAIDASLFVVVGADLATPALGSGARPSAIRRWVLVDPATRALGMEPGERDVRSEDLLAADEAFLASEEAGIVPILGHDGRAIGSGLPGLRTQALRAAREAWLDRVSQAGMPDRPNAAALPGLGSGTAAVPPEAVPVDVPPETAPAEPERPEAAPTDAPPAGVAESRLRAAGPTIEVVGPMSGARTAAARTSVGEAVVPAERSPDQDARAVDTAPSIPLRSRILCRAAALPRTDREQLGQGDVFAWVTTLTPAEIVLMGRVVQEMLRTGTSRHAEQAFGIAWDAGARIPGDDRARMMREFIDLQMTVASVLVGRDLRAEHSAPAKRGLARLFDPGAGAREVETKALEAIDAAGPPARPGLIAIWNAWAAARYRSVIREDVLAMLVRPWESVIGPLLEG